MENIDLIKADGSDFDKIRDFYKFTVENSPTMKEKCRWVYGLHPNDGLIRDYIDNGVMYYAQEEGRVLVAAVILPYMTEDYRSVPWDERFGENDCAELHIFCVNPLFQRRGVARMALKAVETVCVSLGKKTVRLDTLKTNTVAQHLYETSGYTLREVKKSFSNSVGITDFMYYEKLTAF